MSDNQRQPRPPPRDNKDGDCPLNGEAVPVEPTGPGWGGKEPHPDERGPQGLPEPPGAAAGSRGKLGTGASTQGWRDPRGQGASLSARPGRRGKPAPPPPTVDTEGDSITPSLEPGSPRTPTSPALPWKPPSGYSPPHPTHRVGSCPLPSTLHLPARPGTQPHPAEEQARGHGSSPRQRAGPDTRGVSASGASGGPTQLTP